MSIGSIAVSGIGYGALAVALSGFVSSVVVAPLVGEGLEQATELGTAPISQTYAFAGGGLTQTTLLGTGYITQIGPIPEPGLVTGIVEATVIKKPGIPSGTAEWLKTTLEVMLGRRGNRIEVPVRRTLEFSASPTKAECEALYAYTNEVREAVENILIRLDS